MKVIKRDKSVESFNPEKVRKAIYRAAYSVGEEEKDINEIVKLILDKLKGKKKLAVERIQDIIEEVLVDKGEYKIVKSFMLHRQKRAKVRKLAASLGIKDTFHLPLNTLRVLAARYLQKDEKGEIKESPRELFKRVSKAIANVEKKYGKKKEFIRNLEEKFYRVMTSFEFVPNSPTLMNAGTPLGQLAACFVLPVDDSIETIFDAVKWAAMIHRSGGGTGFSFSSIRPAGDIVRSTGGIASGPISWLKIFNCATQEIKQGGRRRGANMGVLNITHPDIFDFITAKTREGEITNFNLSVGIKDHFMKALLKDEHYWLVNPRTGKRVKRLRARAVWDLIITEAWKSGDPGVIFLDTINKSNSNCVPKYGPIEATNPCLTGDTLISTTMGKIPIRNLSLTRSREADVYSMKEGKLVIRHARDIRPTSTRPKQIVEVITTRGSIKCTGDHKFYLLDKGWREALNLKRGDVLVGLREHRRGSKYVGVSLSSQPKNEEIMEHRLVMEYYLGRIPKDTVIHHINGDSFDNRIVNLQVLPSSIHSALNMTGNKRYSSKDQKGRFIQKNVRQLKQVRNTNTPKTRWVVKEVKSIGKEIVYDMYVEETHCFIANGLLVHNCGEIPLYDFEACNLGSINLSRMLKKTNGSYEIDWEKLERTVRLGIRFLDNVIDANKYPLPQIEEQVKRGRRIGLGVMGFADMLILLGIRYNSEEGLETAKKVMSFIQKIGRDESVKLGKEKGNFPDFKDSIWVKKGFKYLRNSAVTGIAPTGTISIIAGGCSSGIEPLFAIAYRRNVSESLGTSLLEVNQLFESIAIKEDFYTEDLVEKISKSTSIQEVKDIPPKIRKLFVTAHDISPEYHIRMQAVFQKYTDNAVSKTINFPKWATPHEIEKAYLLAYQLNCKGITVYRDQSKSVQVLTSARACPECAP